MSVKVLLIENNPQEIELFTNELNKFDSGFLLHSINTKQDISAALAEVQPHVIVCDFLALDLSPSNAVQKILDAAPNLPIIVYSEKLDEEMVVDSLKSGASDYIFKQHPARLGPAILKAIERQRVEEELRQSRERFNTLAKVSTVGIYLATADGFYLYVNDRWSNITGLSSAQAMGEGFLETIHSHDRRRIQTQWRKAVEQGTSFYAEYRIILKNSDDEVWVLSQALPEKMEDGSVIGYVGTITDITERMNSEIQIDQSRKQLRALTVRLQTVREEERTFIAREIHDDLGQALTGLRMDLVWLNKQTIKLDESAQKRLRSMMELIDTTIHKVRKIATDLRPGILDDLGLAAAIEWQGKDFHERTGINFAFQSSIDDVEIDEKRTTAFFRIFQESLTNVVRHAKAKNVSIHLRQEGNNILLTVQDDGKGISQHEINNPRSVGFLGMRERAAVFGGEVSVIGIPSKGTTVLVKIPLSSDLSSTS
ncbi:MAG: PAS domain S-box protein [Bacteroidetes bacterium]|nr:PAS domain S-box protein [Bacteroidota bacterium]